MRGAPPSLQTDAVIHRKPVGLDVALGRFAAGPRVQPELGLAHATASSPTQSGVCCSQRLFLIATLTSAECQRASLVQSQQSTR